MTLDLGEAEAIVLASERGADFLLMDERVGRSIARERGIPTIGLIGALAAAKQMGLLPAVRPVLDALRVEAGFWVGDVVYQQVLRDLGE